MAHLHLLPASVTRFFVANCGITAEGTRVLCKFLESNQTITLLWPIDNLIGDEGAMHIANMLLVNTSLRELCLGNSSDASMSTLSPKFVEYIAEAPATNKTLYKIIFRFTNMLNDDAIKALCQGLAANRGLEDMSLYGLGKREFTPAGLMHIQECLQSNVYFLKELHPFNDVKRDESPVDNQSEISFLLTLNNLNRKIVRDKNATLSDWLGCIIKTSEYERVDFSYFFLRNKPELCMHSRQLQ
jgi:hypothetical protein